MAGVTFPSRLGEVARLVIPAAVMAGACAALGAAPQRPVAQPVLGTRFAAIILRDGLRFRDLDHDGTLTPYEDWRLRPAERARDLVKHMTVAEKVGTLVQSGLPTQDPSGMGSNYNMPAAADRIGKQLITAFVTRAEAAPDHLAAQHNQLQEIAERTRLGIPLILSSDPRHHFFSVIGASSAARYFSQWPDAPGFTAIDDPRVTRRFADIARQEYRAVGLTMTLSPQADLATEPRWARVIGTFGDDPQRVGRQVAAYVEGFQHGPQGLNRDSVIAVVKHWVGYGAAKDGYDSHNYFGRFADLRSGDLQDHLVPFEYAFGAHVATVMPTYSILQGLRLDGGPVEQVGAGFNHALVTGLLRGRYGFKGMVLSDAAITEDCVQTCLGEPGAPNQPPQIGMPWGVEKLSRSERAAKAINAGVDQILGLDDPGVILIALREGLITERQVDMAAERVLEQKFAIGLFENPYVDPAAARQIVGSPVFRAAALDAQRRSFVLLEEKRGVLPLRKPARIFLFGVDPAEARRRGYDVTTNLDEATVAVVRASTPYQTLHPNFFISRFQHAGDLDFKAGDPVLALVTRAAGRIPVIVDVNLERPAVLTKVREKASVLVADFGASDRALFDILERRARPEGRLPFELPSSMEAVRSQDSARPHDSDRPLYASGYRLPRRRPQ